MIKSSLARRGLTRLELLVMLTVAFLILAILIPALQHAREASRRTQCRNNLRQLGLALHNYESAYRMLPAGWIGASEGKAEVFGQNGFSWGPGILPFLEKSLAYNKILFDEHIGSAANDVFRESIPSNHPTAFLCPSDAGLTGYLQWKSTWRGRTVELPSSSYVGVFGSDGLERCSEHPHRQCVGNGALYHNSFLKLTDFRDGVAQTCLLGERRARPDEPEPWLSTWVGVATSDELALFHVLGIGEHAPGDRNATFADFSSAHSGGAFFLMADAHAKFLTTAVDLPTFREMLTTGSKKDLIAED